MKNRINRLLKIGILCFVMALIQTSCEKNDNSIENELQQENKISRVSFSDFNINVTHNRQYQDLERYLDIKKSSNQNLQNRIDADDDITILTDEILVIQKNDISYYTFKLVAPSENNEFYNLVVHVNNQQQIIKSELYEYIPNNDWLQDINQPYTGLIKVLDNDIISLDDLFSARRSGRCLSGASGEWECNEGNNHAPGEGTSCTSWEYFITLEYGPCPNEPVDYIIAEAPTPAGGGGGGTPNQNPTPTIPTIPCGNFGFANGNGDCYDADVINLANQLNDILDDGDNYEIHTTPHSNNALSFDSVDDFEDFLNDQTFQLGQNTILQDGNTKTEFTVKYQGTLAKLEINVISNLKNITTNQEYELLEVNSEPTGLWPLTTWNQSDDEMAHSINNVNNTVTIEFEGTMTYGIDIEGLPLSWSESVKYTLVINILTGQPISITKTN